MICTEFHRRCHVARKLKIKYHNDDEYSAQSGMDAAMDNVA
ncbi:hypothetical protein PAECIP111890_00140 [Paenibacillus sp. JJ-223]|nr:hypothetical protein PAECIP111890_00140 [Paenibacillus sp. JJ-223]